MEIFKLFGSVYVNTEDAQKSLQKVDKDASSTAETLGGIIATAGEFATVFVAAATAVAAAAGAAAVAIYEMANSTAETADRIDKMSQKIGVSRETFQEFDFICSQSGMSVENLQSGMKTLVKQMQKVQGRTEDASTAFGKLGLSIFDSNGELKSQEDMLYETITALQGMENQTEKAALATNLFGRTGTEMMPLLNQQAGSIDEMKQKAHELGLIMSDDLIDGGVKLKDTIDQTQRAVKAIGVSIGSAFVPVVTQVLQKLQSLIPIADRFAEKIGPAVQWVVDDLAKSFNNTGDSFSKLGMIVDTVYKSIFKPMIDFFNEYVDYFSEDSDFILSKGQEVMDFFEYAGNKVWNELLEPIFESVQEVLETLFATIIDNLPYLEEKSKKAWATVEEIFTDLEPIITQILKEIREEIIPAVTILCEKVLIPYFGKAFGFICDFIIDTLLPVIAGVVEFLSGAFTLDFETAMSGIEKIADTILGNIKDAFTEKFEAVKDIVFKAIEYIKGLFDFEWSLPTLKVPHVTVNGGSAPWGIGGLGELPSFDVEWYAKAMEAPIVMNKPTAFGINANGQIMAGGEAGSEVVTGTETLLRMIAEAVSANNEVIAQEIRDALEGTTLSINNREFARLVKAVN